MRDAIDKAGAQGGELLHIGPLREAESSAAAMQIIERLTDVEIAEAHQSASTWFGVQSQIAPLDSFVSFLHALDWLNLKQPVEKAAVRAWLDGQYGDPILIMLGKVEPVAKASAASGSSDDRMKKQRFDAGELFEHLQRIIADARALIAEERFLNWQIAFPGVWGKWSSKERVGGCDAVVGNPPWDVLEFEEVPWFAARDASISQEGTLFFPDVYYRFKFSTYIAGGIDRTFSEARYGFFIRSLAEVSDSDRVFPITAEEIRRINPNSGTAPIFRSKRDKDITAVIYARLPVLADRSMPELATDWSIRCLQMLNMTTDSDVFRSRAELENEERAWPVGGNRWQSARGEWVPLYEGKMVQAFDHRASDIVLAEANVFRSGQGSDLTADDHGDPSRFPNPRYWVRAKDTGWDAPTDWCVSMKDVTSVTNARTVISAIIPRYGAGHTLPVLLPGKGDDNASYVQSAPLLLANLNCVILDYLARQKVHGNHLAWYLLEQLPVVRPSDYTRMFGPKSAAEIVREAVLELTYTAHDMAPFARDMGYVDANGEALPPFAWNEARRLNLRAKLDALYFILYGVFDPADPAGSRDDIRYIYSTFPIVAQQERDKWGDYKSEEFCLAWVNALTAGQPDAAIGV